MIPLLACFLLGGLLGALACRIFGGGNPDELRSENESLQVELETRRSQVDGHFATSAVMFQNLTEEYRKLLEHMSAGAQALEVELPEPMLADFSAAAQPRQITNDPSSVAADSDQDAAATGTPTIQPDSDTQAAPANDTTAHIETTDEQNSTQGTTGG